LADPRPAPPPKRCRRRGRASSRRGWCRIPRRFDARFFLAEAAELAGAAHDDFAGGGEELSHLRWLDLGEARALPLPFITEVVLAELGEILADPDPDRPVPFFDQTPEGARFRML
jgi:8-oxo-dGTP pyrophosphatase MutT (NUDIX family)